MDGMCLFDDYKVHLRLEWISGVFVKRKAKSPRNSKESYGLETDLIISPRILISGICEFVHRVQITY